MQFTLGALLGKLYDFGLEFLIGMLVAGMSAIFGIFFGIKGLKLAKRSITIIGIVISSVSLLLCVWGLIEWYVMGGGCGYRCRPDSLLGSKNGRPLEDEIGTK